MAEIKKKIKKKSFLAQPDDRLTAVLDNEFRRMRILERKSLDILKSNDEIQQWSRVHQYRKFTMEIAGEFLIEVAHTASVKQACTNLRISRTSYNNFVAKNGHGERLWFTVQMLAAPNKKERAGAVRKYIDETYGDGTRPTPRRRKKKTIKKEDSNGSGSGNNN